MLTDPRADDLDVRELSRPSDELRIKLFGTAADDEVTLLLFEGPLDVVTAFVTLDDATVARALIRHQRPHRPGARGLRGYRRSVRDGRR